MMVGSIWGIKMQIKQKELGQDIVVSFDSKNYKTFVTEVKKLSKQLEFNSNPNKLNYSIVLNCRRTPHMAVNGWASRVITANGVKEVVFVDYDDILYRLVEEELGYIQKFYNLSPFYVFKTFEAKDVNGEEYGNYIAVSVAKKTYGEVIEILRQLHCDSSYKVVPTSYPYKTWVLRLGRKGKKGPPLFKCIVGDLAKDYSMECSQAHLEILEQVYPETKSKVKYTNLDGNHELYLSKYKTASK